MQIDVRPDHLELIKNALKLYVPDRQVVAFGSRVKWTARDTSDLDICVMGEEKIPFESLAALRDELSNSSLPYKVDVIDWAGIKPDFRKIIEQRNEQIQSPDKSGWRICKLADICKSIDYGLTASAEDLPTDFKFLRITDITAGNIDWNKVPFVSIDSKDAKKYQLYEGDIVVARTGATTGVSAYIKNPPKAVFASYLVRYRINELNDSRYVAYYLKSDYWWRYIRGVLGDKSAQPNASASTMSQALIKLPSLSEQRRIADVLSALDNKIDTNRSMILTLDGVAKTIFKSWFLDSKVATSKQKKILDGWKNQTLEEVSSELRRGIGPSYTNEGGTRVINQKCIRNNSVDYTPARYHDSSKKRIDGRLLKKGDILVNSTGVGTLGRVAQIWDLDVDTIVDSHVTIVRADTGKINPIYLGYNLMLRENEIEGLGHGSTGQTELSREVLGKLPILVPPTKLQKAFEQIAEPLLTKIDANFKEIQRLSQLRDGLIPKLLSGEFRINLSQEVV